MIIYNVNIYTEHRSFRMGFVEIIGNKIQKVKFQEEPFPDKIKKDGIDGNGGYLIPGLIDLHFHGCNGYDFCDGTHEAFEQIAKYELMQGVTSIVPATMTLSGQRLEDILESAALYVEKIQSEDCTDRSTIIGINMEGPFISKRRKGAQDEAHIRLCDVECAKRFLEKSKGLVKMIGIAPEEQTNSSEFIEEMKNQVHLSLAHTDADYETAKEAFSQGVDYVVHLHNAMRSFHHREPGIFGATAETPNVFAELVCDGIHVHPAAVKTTIRTLGEERVLFVSDSMRATGLVDGVYLLGGQEVKVSGKQARLLADDSLAGSVTHLMDGVRAAVHQMGISLETAVGCASTNPSKFLGIFEQYGSITEGKRADIVLLDHNLNIQKVIKKGALV